MQEHEVRSSLAKLLTRAEDSQKYDYGHVLIIGGSAGMVGAPLLSAKAAFRSGAGLVSIASGIADTIAGLIPECMTKQLPTIANDALSSITALISERHVSIIVIGPGLAAEAAELVRSVVQEVKLPVVLDGGGLMAFTDHLDLLAEAAEHNPDIIITPHSGEYQKLSGTMLAADRKDRADQVSGFAKANKLTVLAKSHVSLVASPDGELFANHTGNPGLATAGSGDALTGIIGALRGQRLTNMQAAAGGVYLLGQAADIAVQSSTEPGLMASDIASHLAAALRSCA
jgi:hydroxyethylthiazole kinase-like uncharacterized protein yjeF